eukprot:SAG22_NODE_3329_length_1775_cov_6.273866_2_plen_179_part_00
MDHTGRETAGVFTTEGHFLPLHLFYQPPTFSESAWRSIRKAAASARGSLFDGTFPGWLALALYTAGVFLNSTGAKPRTAKPDVASGDGGKGKETTPGSAGGGGAAAGGGGDGSVAAAAATSGDRAAAAAGEAGKAGPKEDAGPEQEWTSMVDEDDSPRAALPARSRFRGGSEAVIYVE